MGALKGDVSKLQRLAQVIRDTPEAIRKDVAKRGAPVLTAELQGTYEGKASAYGDPNPVGVNGQQLTLKETGALDAALQFTATGSRLATGTLPRYARYLIGKYRVLPIGNTAMPEAWRKRLEQLVRTYKPPAV